MAPRYYSTTNFEGGLDDGTEGPLGWRKLSGVKELNWPRWESDHENFAIRASLPLRSAKFADYCEGSIATIDINAHASKQL
jgi:hypothetical protein